MESYVGSRGSLGFRLGISFWFLFSGLGLVGVVGFGAVVAFSRTVGVVGFSVFRASLGRRCGG